MSNTTISQRKADHLDLAVAGDVGFKQTTNLFECLRLVHDALPELELQSIDLETHILGKVLRAPLLIAGMTGGTERASRINRQLAGVAEQRGYAFGLGSQRPMLERPELVESYRVREVAPTALLLGNIGAVQAARLEDEQLFNLVQSVGADALCVHLNPAMELVQPGGDRDFRGCLARLGALAQSFALPVVVKETGCGLSAQVAARLRSRGILHVDVSGAGGTSWVALEGLRCRAAQRQVGQAFAEWGIPTAASVALLSKHGFATLFATGGVATGLEVAKAIALGASAAGIARPVLQALEAGGPAAVHELFDQIETELRMTMLLVGAADLRQLGRVPRVIVGELAEWIRQGGCLDG
jgi:isopentenyl-diphosphate delta-isomerase